MAKGAMFGKTCVVTGANSGIGKATAEGLLRMDARVVLFCRNRARGEEAREELADRTGKGAPTLVVCDLARLDSIREAVSELLDLYDRLDVLINNAGIWTKDRTVTADGFETQFAVNHLGPFYLTHLLMDRLLACAPARIVNVSSELHRQGRVNFDDLQFEQGYKGLRAYSNTKLFNVLITKELARRYPAEQLTANCLHPGVVATNISRDLPKPMTALARYILTSPEKGARTSLFLASSDGIGGVTGEYFVKMRPKKVTRDAEDAVLAKRLWDVSMEMLGLG